jgi:N-acetylmuramoyl-L-alanine amidase CwlA
MKSILLISFLVLIISSTNDPSLYEVMDYISSSVINYKIKAKNIKVWALEDYYEHELIPSVSLYLFEDIKMIENIAPEGNPNRPGDKHEKKYITVHDTGDFAYSAGERSQHVYDAKIGNSSYDISYQYVVGNDGYYHNIPDDETAYHAGDGATQSSWFQEFETGVYGDKEDPHVSISTDGYYTIEGKKTKVLAPTDNKGNILDESYFNDMRIYTTVKDGMYYIGSTWYSETYNKIGNHGGNTNSIGIESCVNRGSDIYWTWQRLAKLVAKLMDDNNLTMRQIVQHHYYSGKDCPQTMRTEGYWNHFMNLVEVEYQMLQYKKIGFSFEFTPLNSKYVNNIGRVINRGFYLPLNANFVVKVTDSKGDSLSEVFSSSIPPKNL